MKATPTLATTIIENAPDDMSELPEYFKTLKPEEVWGAGKACILSAALNGEFTIGDLARAMNARDSLGWELLGDLRYSRRVKEMYKDTRVARPILEKIEKGKRGFTIADVIDFTRNISANATPPPIPMSTKLQAKRARFVGPGVEPWPMVGGVKRR